MAWRFFLFLVLLWSTCPVSAQVGRAVVIGIGQYADKEWNVIHGDRDVVIVEQMLQEFGYEDIHTLVNEQATKQAIVEQFCYLAEHCGKGDRVYVHFSGHGQRMSDIDGDEEDGWDEAWIPYDACLKYSSSYTGTRHLSDDEIGYWMTRIRRKIGKEGQLLLVVDACHSGDSSRNLDTVCVRGVFRDFVIPVTVKQNRQKIREEWLTLSACKSYQLNCELPTKYGRLTYALFSNRLLLPGLSNEELLQLVKDYMDQNRTGGMRPQSPELTGERMKYSINKLFK